jgi:hypothetical protein
VLFSVPLQAPLRAYRYSVAGGRCTKVEDLRKKGKGKRMAGDELGWKCSEPLFNVAWDDGHHDGRGNPFSNKVVVMDEVHNMMVSNGGLLID